MQSANGFCCLQHRGTETKVNKLKQERQSALSDRISHSECRKTLNVHVPFISQFSRGEQKCKIKGVEQHKYDNFISTAKGKLLK